MNNVHVCTAALHTHTHLSGTKNMILKLLQFSSLAETEWSLVRPKDPEDQVKKKNL